MHKSVCDACVALHLESLSLPGGEGWYAALWRSRAGEGVTFELHAEAPWSLFAGRTVQTVDRQKPVLSGTGGGRFLVPLPQSQQAERVFFELAIGGESFILAERHLPLTGAFNMRDLGGFRTQCGKSVQWGKLYRSDDLSALTQGDKHYVESLGLKTLIDFRTDYERNVAPNRMPSTVSRSLHYAITPGTISPQAVGKAHTPEEAEALMCSVYEHFVHSEQIRSLYKAFFVQVQATDAAPLLFHCSAGKDRTGFAAALILYALGVDEAVIMDDFMASRVYLSGKYANPSLFFTVKARFLQTALAAIADRYGTVEHFLVQALDVDIAGLRALYLEE